MERLTYRPKAPYVSRATGKLIKAFSDNEIREIIHRLADYEDTGLTPEEVTAMRHTLDEYHKVADPLLRAQADGRVWTEVNEQWTLLGERLLKRGRLMCASVAGANSSKGL